MSDSIQTEAIDKLFLELSQVTKAKTAKEIGLESKVERLRNALLWIDQPDHPIGSNAEFVLKAQRKAREALGAIV